MISKFEAIRQHYDHKADIYDAGYREDQPNHHRLSIVKQIIEKYEPVRVLDAGCGTGQILKVLAEQGVDCLGIDISAKMLAKARSRLDDAGFTKIPLMEASLDDLTALADNEFDAVFAISVFPYLEEEIEKVCFKEIRRVLKPCGLLVASYQNEIFDLFTFNRYTTRFFERNILPLISDGRPGTDLSTSMEKLASLITHPDEPPMNSNPLSSRDVIFSRPENPLTLSAKMERSGYRLLENLFYHFHALPPLAMNGDSMLENVSRELEGRLSNSWQGLFMASAFVCVCRAEGEQ